MGSLGISESTLPILSSIITDYLPLFYCLLCGRGNNVQRTLLLTKKGKKYGSNYSERRGMLIRKKRKRVQTVDSYMQLTRGHSLQSHQGDWSVWSRYSQSMFRPKHFFISFCRFCFVVFIICSRWRIFVDVPLVFLFLSSRSRIRLATMYITAYG